MPSESVRSVGSICGHDLISRSSTIAKCWGAPRKLPRCQSRRVMSWKRSSPSPVNAIDTIGWPNWSKSCRVPSALMWRAGHLRDRVLRVVRLVAEEVVVRPARREVGRTRLLLCRGTGDDDRALRDAEHLAALGDARVLPREELLPRVRPAPRARGRSCRRGSTPTRPWAPSRPCRRGARRAIDVATAPWAPMDGPMRSCSRSKSSSWAVFPISSAAFSGSVTPASWMTISSEPCLRSSGSATPSLSMRFRMMFTERSRSSSVSSLPFGGIALSTTSRPPWRSRPSVAPRWNGDPGTAIKATPMSAATIRPTRVR